MEPELASSRAEQPYRATVSDPVGRRASAALRVFAVAAIGLVMTACGGGGGGSGGGGGGGGNGGVGNVTVTVTDEANAAVPGALVAAGTKSGTTAADGTVTLSGLPSGAATVTVSKDLYVTATKSVSIPRDSTAAAAVKINRKKGSIAATVTDQFGPIQNATITATVDGKNFKDKTDANGKVTLASIPTGSVAVSVVASGFKNKTVVPNPTVAENAETLLPITLERSTQAAGGFVLSRVVGTPTNNGQTIQFKVQLLIVDENSAAVETLTPGDFTLQRCVVDATNTAPECIRSASVSEDVGYAVSIPPSESTVPPTFLLIDGNDPKPYAAAMVLDQSDSIKDSDPTDARIFASKTFLEKVGVNDRVVLSAFAVDSGTFNLAKIPVQPLTIYGSFTADGASYFDVLDQLAKQEGGETPLYDSLNSMVDYTRTNAPPGIPGQLKAAVLFSDGEDTVCADKKVCRDNVINNAIASGVDLFTIGLSDKVDFEAMAELADRANGMFLFAESAEQLLPIYGALGNLLSRSLATYEVTWTIQADAAGAFLPGRTILGSVQVRTASNPVNLPVIVRIPSVP